MSRNFGGSCGPKQAANRSRPRGHPVAAPIDPTATPVRAATVRERLTPLTLWQPFDLVNGPYSSPREFYETLTGEVPLALPLPRLGPLHRSRRGARLRRIRHQPLSQFVSGSRPFPKGDHPEDRRCFPAVIPWRPGYADGVRSEEHTSELQSLRHLVCR